MSIAKLLRHLRLILPLLVINSSIPQYILSPAYAFEVITGGQYLGEVEKEIRGVKAIKYVTPSDNYYSTQKNYSMNNLGDIESVWDNYTGKGTTIAVIDDGFDHDHGEYTRSDGTSAISNESAYFYYYSGSYGVKYYKNDNTVIDENYDDGWDTHGTNTSSTAAAPMGNGGIVGIAPDATILALKIDMSFAAIKGAINYAVKQKVDVINMSLGAYAETFTDVFGTEHTGSTSTSTYLNSVCTSAYNAGIIVVAAAGNEATSTKSYPACNSHVIGVGALYKNSNTTLAPFTNYVDSSQTGEVNVDILAPGFVYAAGIKGTSSSSHSQIYHATQGTSFSSPIVAGAACLWKQKNPNGTPDEFLNELQQSADNIGAYKSKYVPTSMYSGISSDVGPSNITNGQINVASLLSYNVDVTGISLSNNSINLTDDGSLTSSKLTATVTPSGASKKNIIWENSNSSVVSLSSSSSLSGEAITLTSKSQGTATITAYSYDKSYSSSCEVTVSSYVAVSSLSLLDKDGNSSSTLTPGGTIQLYPKVLPENASDQDYIVESEDTTIAKVDANYLVTAVSVGETDIVMMNDDYLEAKYHVVVSYPEGTGELVINVYDTSTLIDTTSTNSLTVNSFENKVTIDGETNNKVITDYEGSYTYLRKGGIALSTGSNNGSFTLTTSTDYKIYSVTVIGALWDDKGVLKLNSNSGTGSLNTSGTTLDNCSSSLVFSNLNGTNTLAFSSTNRTVIYKIICECSIPQPVYAESITLSSSSLSLDLIKNTTSTLTATVLPIDADNRTVTFSSSNDLVANVDQDGKVTAIGVGECVIKAVTNDGTNLSATCNVVVSEGVKVTSLSISGGESSCPYMSDYDYSSLKIVASYSDGSSNDVTSSALLTKIDTSKLGIKTIYASYTEYGYTVEASFDVKITNVGADSNVGEAEDKVTTVTDTTTFTSSTWGHDGTKKWDSIIAGNDYLNDGVQCTDKSSGTKSANCTSVNEFNNVSKVVVNYCTNKSDGAGSIQITIGSNNAHTLSVTSTGGTTSRTLTFTINPNESGKVNLLVNCTANSIYIQGISITYSLTEKVSSFKASPEEQAIAWSTYFIETVTPFCDSSGVNSDVSSIANKWDDLANEYKAMISLSKNEFVNSADETIVKARNLYTLIYSKYHDSLNDNNFVTDGNGSYLNQQSVNIINVNSYLLPILLIGFVIIFSSISGYLLVRRKRH